MQPGFEGQRRSLAALRPLGSVATLKARPPAITAQSIEVHYVAEFIVVAPEGRTWAVKHNGGFLGRVGSCDEAVTIAQQLVQWIDSQGREGRLEVIGQSQPPFPASTQ